MLYMLYISVMGYLEEVKREQRFIGEDQVSSQGN